MKTKFSKKLLSLFLAMLMLLSVMSAGFSAFAANDREYVDDNISYNAIGWALLSKEQVATALLDEVDELLADFGPSIDNALKGAIGSMYNKTKRQLSLAGIITIDFKFNSVDEILETLEGLNSALNSYGGIIGGDVKNIDLSAAKGVRRNGTGARDVVIAQTLFNIIYSNTKVGNSVIKQVISGKLDLGLLGNFFDLYGILQGLFNGIPDGYQQNLVNNIVVHLVSKAFGYTYVSGNNASGELTLTFADENGKTYTIDEFMFKLLSEELLQKINVEVTYSGASAEYGQSSRTHYENILAYMEKNGGTQADAAKALGYDPSLVYTSSGNVRIFQYDSNLDGEDDVKLSLDNTDNLFDFAYRALEVAWKTVLNPTLGTVDSTTKNFDNDYHDWSIRNGYVWNYDNVAANYTEAQLNAWAADTEKNLDDVKHALCDYSRDIVADPTYTYKDINSTALLNKLRYSPMVEYYFAAQDPTIVTGPLNLALECTGLKNTQAFMANNYSGYSSILAGLNDFLVALVKDMFPGYTDTLRTTGNTTNASSIASTLITNAAAVFQYAADATDKNILSGFYKNYGSNAVLSEANFEEAMIPFFISAILNIDLVGHIHTTEWDACKDAEGVAAVCLKEYLSYILPDLDYSALMTKDANGYYDVTLLNADGSDGAIMKMARDAVGYVMYQYVPIFDKQGNPWNVYESKVSDTVTVFDLLNSVINYYAVDCSVGAMLGLVDSNGKCKISTSNTIWQNIDLVVNKFLPVIGELQYGTTAKAGAASSEDLIYNDLIKGLLNIGDTSVHTSGLGGISNFIYRFATIAQSPSISTKSVDLVVYDFLKDLLNGLFTKRTNETYENPVPAASSASPFNDVVQSSVITGAKDDSNDIGMLGKAFVNLSQFSGFGNNTDTLLRGVMFVIQSVNSFLNFVPTLQEYDLDMVNLSMSESSISGYTAGQNRSTTLYVTNDGDGLNRAIIDKNGNVVQLSRSYIRLNSITPNVSGINLSYSTSTLIPAKTTLNVGITAKLNSSLFTNNECLVTYTINYDILDEDGNEIAEAYNGLEREVYQYYTTAPDWYSLTYTDNGEFQGGTKTPNSSAQFGDYSTMSGSLGGGTLKGGHMGMQLPNDIVIKTSEVESLGSKIRLYAKNNTSSRIGSDMTINKVYVCDLNKEPSSEKTDSQYVQVTIDSTTGDVINSFYYDYYLQNYDANGNPVAAGSGWVTAGVDAAGLANAKANLAANQAVLEDRFHVVCAHDDIQSHFGNYTEYKNADGTYKAIYIQYSALDEHDYSKTNASYPTYSAGIPGLVLAFQSVKLSKGGEADYYTFIEWDGRTTLEAASVDVNFYISSQNIKEFDMNITVCDDSEAADIQTTYDEVAEFVTAYNAEDFTDAVGTGADATSDSLDYLKDSIAEALAKQATAITAANAADVASNKAYFAETTTTTSFYGDKAMTPLTTADNAPIALTGSSTEHNGFYYQTVYTDKTDGKTYYENPIYKMVALTDSAVSNESTVTIGEETYTTGTDAAGAKVVKVDDTWYLLNEAVYEKEWVETDSSNADPVFLQSPYQADTKVQATNSKDELLYAVKTYVYRDANIIKVNSTENPVYKLAATTYRMVDGAANRGIYAIALDRINYAYGIALTVIQARGAEAIYEQVSVVRRGLQNIDYNIVSYEKMVDMAREAEGLINVDKYFEYLYNDEVIFSCLESEFADTLAAYNEANDLVLTDKLVSTGEEDVSKAVVTSTSTSFRINESVRLFDVYLDYVTERGYIGAKLENEISCAAEGKNHDETACAVNATYKNIAVDVANAAYTVNGVTYTADSNPDEVVYTEESWNDFIVALDDAVDAANDGNGSYKYKESDYYVSSDKEGYTLSASDVYEIRKSLMVAENNLTVEGESASGYTVTAYIGGLAAPTDAYGTYAVEGAVVTVGDLTAVTDADGMFTLEGLDNGTYPATVTYAYGYERTFTIVVDGADVVSDTMVGIVHCNLNGDPYISGADYSIYAQYVGMSSSNPDFPEYVNLNKDPYISGADYAIYAAFVGKTPGNMTYTDTVISN